jgi:tetratricopeptide (TPR) repeat protein
MHSDSSNIQISGQLKQAQLRHEQGRLQEALTLYRQVLALDPASFQALHGIGILYGQLGRFEQALQFINGASIVKPGDYSVYYNQGKALQELKRYNEALTSYDKALALKPDYVPAYNNRGNVLKALERYEEALASFDAALSLRPDFLDAHINRGSVLQALKRYGEALASYGKALVLDPNCAEAYYNRGNILNTLERHGDILSEYDKALDLNPDYVPAHNNRGNILKELERYEEALASFDTALSLEPDNVPAHNNRGIILKNLDRYEEALASYKKALTLKPNYAEAYNNMGGVLTGLRRYDDALACYEKAIALWPDYADANFNMGLLKLLLGDYEAGWLLHEWRWKTEQHKDNTRKFEQPLWLGEESPAGRTVLLHVDQGLGDVIQVARYVPMLAALGATVILEVPSSLVPLLNTLEGAAAVIAKGEDLPEFELQCPFMSLPLAFKTKIDTIPGRGPYLGVDPQKRLAWRERLGSKSRRRIGLTWSGNANHKNDRNRSIGLRKLRPLLSLDCEFHAVQKEARDEDRTILAEFVEMRSHEAELHDFSETAALISELDLVITVDTSVAHLAGALGKEVWILIPYAPDYRWMTERSDSPWYPTARLFRQRSRGNWEDVITEVLSSLQS